MYEKIEVTNGNVQRKRKRCGKDEQVEQALKKWFTDVRSQDARVNGLILHQKVADLAKALGKENFNACEGEGWFHRWKNRENIVWIKPLGELSTALCYQFWLAQM